MKITDSGVLKPHFNEHPIMEVTRIIHPVGHGGFYTETFPNGTEESTFVYDCGGFGCSKRGATMGKYLKGFLLSHKKIEAVFISHFHWDHINGLQYLLDNAEVKYLFLPQYTLEVMAEAFLYNYIVTGDKNINTFLLSLLNDSTKYKSTNVIQVSFTNDHHVPDNLTPVNSSDESNELKAWDWGKGTSIDLSKTNRLPASTLLYFGKWLYIPYNSKVPADKMKGTVEELIKKLELELSSLTDFSASLAQINVEKCKEAYDAFFIGGLNQTSMTLFSGSTEDVVKKFGTMATECSDCQPFCDLSYQYQHCCNPNILYTGDYEPATDKMGVQFFYSKFWKNIATIQIPHHGSIYNYDKALYEYPVRGIVSAREDCSKHPDKNILKMIQNQKFRTITVTKELSSKLTYQYAF